MLLNEDIYIKAQQEMDALRRIYIIKNRGRFQTSPSQPAAID
jgi:hypothetical protein